MNYRLSDRAALELDDIVSESASQFGKAQAASYAAGLRESLAMLAQHPGVARVREELVAGTRAYRYKAHMIVYRQEDDGILIIRPPHVRSDWISDPD